VTGDSAAVRAAPPRQHGSEADRAAVPTDRSKAAAHLRSGCRCRLCPGSRQAVPSVHHRLHRELGRTALLTPVRPRRALFPHVASRVPVRFPSRPLLLHRPSAPSSCRRNGVVARAQAGPGRRPRTRCVGQAGPGWAACTPCKPAAPVLTLGRKRIRPIGLRFTLLFSVYIQINANSKICTRFI
jgi:hypothetical protein